MWNHHLSYPLKEETWNMVEKVILITNNDLVLGLSKSNFETVFVDGGLAEVLKVARDYIHKGHILFSHPLSGSIKPNQTPYKTVLISKSVGETIDVKSLNIIEESIITTEKFLRFNSCPKWSREILNDFKYVDFDMISQAIS